MRTLLFTYLQPENNYKSHFSTNSQYKLPSSNLMDRPKFYVIAIVLEVQSMGIILSLLIIEKYLFSPFYVFAYLFIFSLSVHQVPTLSQEQ